LAGRQDPLKLELNRDTNIFYGLNGSGKTSLLKILHAAMANETGILARVPFTSAEVRIYSLTWKKVFTRSVKKSGSTTPSRSKSGKAIHRDVLMGNEMVLFEAPEAAEELKWLCKPKVPEEASSTRWAHEYLSTSRLHVSDEPIGYFDASRPSRTWLTEDQLDKFFARSVQHLWTQYSAQVLGAVRMAQERGLASILRAVLSPEIASSKRRTSKLTNVKAY